MTVLQASRLTNLLNRAKGTGIVEEPATICGLDLVFQSLSPDELTSIYESLQAVEEDVAYMLYYQKEHVCRSIVEIDGEDFRGVKFIEKDVIDPETGETKTVNVPRHEWVLDNLINTWSKDVIYTAFRKYMDAADAAEKKASEGVTFRIEAETGEEKFRRLLIEALEASAEIPEDMREVILREHNLIPISSKTELDEINERVREVSQKESEKLSKAVQEGAEQAPVPQPPPRVEQPEAPPVRAPEQLRKAVEPSPEELMEKRQRLNQEPIQPPVPRAQNVQMANPRSGPPPEEEVVRPVNRRAAELAALEASAIESGGVPIMDGIPEHAQRYGDDGVLEEKVDRDINLAEVQSNLNQPPVAGVNKKFVDPRGPRRLGGVNPRKRAR